MKRRAASPFLRLSESTRVSEWICEINDGAPFALSDLLPDWDYSAGLKVSRTITIDAAQAGREIGLDLDGAPLAAVVEIGAGPGSLAREIIHRHHLPLAPDGREHTIELDLSSHLISEQISLKTVIILDADVASSNLLAPSRRGSRLWEDRQVSRVEGNDPRFPMEVVSFHHLFRKRPHEHAPWFLRWNPGGLDRDFFSAIRLYLNEDCPEFVDRVQAQDPLTLQALMGDVLSQVCEGALNTPDGVDHVLHAEELTLGGQVRHWLLRAFATVPEAKAFLDQRPGEFRAAIVASVSFQ